MNGGVENKMQVASNSLLTKTTRVLTAGVRSASCNRGWLQICTHIICGSFTVISFILILVATLKPPMLSRNITESRCRVTSCRVICDNAPYYEEYEDDIVMAVMEASTICQNVFLTLRQPTFINASLPRNWLQELRPVITELGISGGNLQHFSPNAFSSAFARVEILFFQHITIKTWTPYTLLGLSNLSYLLIKNCVIDKIQENVLTAVGQTVQTLSIVKSGHFDPKYLTGVSLLSHRSQENFPMLTTVDLSQNDFGAVLGNTSFTKLHYCKSLYLSSSKISYIGPGAFDNMVNLEYLNLNDNLIRRLPPGLFDVITSVDTKRLWFNLVDNPWHCHCSNKDLRRLASIGVLIVDPVCHTPGKYKGKTFHELNDQCRLNEPQQIVIVGMNSKNINVGEVKDNLIHSLTCISKASRNSPILVSPFTDYPCQVDVLKSVSSPSIVLDFNSTDNFNWIKPLLVVRKDNFTMMELRFTGIEGYGLIWYRSSCVNDVYCVNVMPDTIRLYDMDINNEYTFCPVALQSGMVKSTECIAYASTATTERTRSTARIIFYPLIAVSCLFSGAMCLYLLIRKYPFLLKGSKRLLFVKHKTVEALVLPPKVPLRGVLSDSSRDVSKDTFEMPEPLPFQSIRTGSVRSSHSYAPSYISALQPTEEQLTDWRFKHANETYEQHYSTISTISSDMPISLLSGSDHLYFSLEDGSPTVSIIGSFNQNCENKNLSLGHPK